MEWGAIAFSVAKLQEYKINTQKSLLFLYTNNEKSEIKESIPFTIATKNKYLGINLPKEKKTPRVGDGQGGLLCCDSWGRKELDRTEQLI